jgi:hypothetical protein
MVRPCFEIALVLCSLSPAVCMGEVANLTGTWRLNVEKSRWGSMKKPVSVIVEVRHEEPSLEYRGTVMYANEETRDFVFKGGIDGKRYPMTRSYGSGSIALERTSERTFNSVFETADGRYIESATTSLSSDGKVIRRTLRLKTGAVEKRWTELYERQ